MSIRDLSRRLGVRRGLTPPQLSRELRGTSRGQAPELNIIQAPEIVNRLTRALGVRQAHVLPTMSETVHPVVILHDATQEPVSTAYATFRQPATILNARFMKVGMQFDF